MYNCCPIQKDRTNVTAFTGENKPRLAVLDTDRKENDE